MNLQHSSTTRKSAYTVTAFPQQRPADTTAYAAGDVVGLSTGDPIQFSNIGQAESQLMLTSALLRIDVAAVPAGMANQRLHLYNAAPGAIADNAAFNLPSADRSKYLGWIDLGTPVDQGDTIVAQADQINKALKLAPASTSLWGFLQTMAAYTPTASAVSTITLHAVAL